MPDRDEAQRRVRQIRAFRAELDLLRRAGVTPMSDEQDGAIRAFHDEVLRQLQLRYDVDASEAAGQLSLGMRLLSFFAAATLTAAVYSLVARFWGRLDVPTQASLLAAFPLMALVGVELSARRERTFYVASLFALVAYGTFWLAVWMLSWIFNIPVTPSFLWAGVLFGLALAIPYGFRLILGVTLLALAVSVAGSMFAAAGTEWTQLMERLEPLTFAGFSSLALAPRLQQLDRAFAPVTRLVALGIGFFGLLVMSEMGSSSWLPVSSGAAEAIYQAVTLVAAIAVLVVAVRKGWRETINLAAVVLALFLLLRYFDWFSKILPRYVFFLGLAAIAFVWLFFLRRLRRRLYSIARPTTQQPREARES